MENKEPPFAFEKILCVNEPITGLDINLLGDLTRQLLYCMKETNKLHDVHCEFFRLDYRQQYFHEQLYLPHDCFVLDMKWGHKDELKSKEIELGRIEEEEKEEGSACSADM